MPFKLGRIGGIDGLDSGGEGLAVGRDGKPGVLQGRSNQVAHLAALVLHAHDEFQPDRLVVEMPDIVHQLGAGCGHGVCDLLAGVFGIIVHIGLLDHVEDGQIVIVGGGHVGVHRRGLALVDLPGHEFAVDQALHGLPHLFDREGVQPSFGRGRRVEDQRYGAGRGLEELDALVVAQLAGRGDLQIEVVEVHLAGFQVQRSAVHVERFEVEPLDRGPGLLVRGIVLGQGRGGEADHDRQADRDCLEQPCRDSG